MTTNIHVSIAFATACVLAAAQGCQNSDQTLLTVPPSPPTPLTIVAPSGEPVVIPRTLQLSSKGGGDIGPVSWESDDEFVATISPSGLVTTKYPGSTLIRARRGGSVAVLTVTARASYINLLPSTVILAPNTSQTLTAVVLDANGAMIADVPVGWTTSNAAVASVSANGLLTAVTVGDATFSAIGGGTSAGGFIHVSTSFSPIAFSTIGSIGNHLCGLEASSGRAFCWGDNHAGALGNPSLDASDIPGPVSGDHRFSTLSVGDYATCAIEKETGSAYCWGENTYGDLGDGSVQTRWDPTLVAAGAIRFSDISANGSHTCAVEALTGLGYCWGKGSLIGDGTMGQRSTPTLVGDNARRIRFTSISAGSFHSCGIEAGTGTAYCWGQNNLGAIGDGTVIDRLLPVLVGPELSFSNLSAGTALTCGVEATTKAGYCWGTNSFGQIGDGTTINRNTPTRVADGRRFSSISATGNAHACGIEADTALAYCWGRYVSQVTTGPATSGPIPTVVGGGTMRFKSIVATYAGGCGVEAQTGRGYCWDNSRLTPFPVLPPASTALLSLGVGASR